jgi:hypothetical protein
MAFLIVQGAAPYFPCQRISLRFLGADQGGVEKDDRVLPGEKYGEWYYQYSVPKAVIILQQENFFIFAVIL